MRRKKTCWRRNKEGKVTQKAKLTENGEKRTITTICNYCNNKLFILSDHFLLANVTKGKAGNC